MTMFRRKTVPSKVILKANKLTEYEKKLKAVIKRKKEKEKADKNKSKQQ